MSQKKGEDSGYSEQLKRKVIKVLGNKNFGKHIGDGNFGSVFKIKIDGKAYAVKQIKEEHTSSTVYIKRELELGEKLFKKHPNILAYCALPLIGNRQYLLMDFCDKGNLNNYLEKEESILNHTLFDFMTDILHGLRYLHENKIIHRDIKPGNILVKSSERDTCVIGDFGLARYFDRSSINPEEYLSYANPRDGTCLGTYVYMAPEVLHHMLSKSKYSFSADTYSCGLLFSAMLQYRFIDHQLLPSVTYQNEEKNVTFLVLFKRISAEELSTTLYRDCRHISKMVARMVHLDPDMRPRSLDVIKCIEQYRDCQCSAPMESFHPGRMLSMRSTVTKPAIEKMQEEPRQNSSSTYGSINSTGRQKANCCSCFLALLRRLSICTGGGEDTVPLNQGLSDTTM